jgi:CBS domain-containing protein
VVGDLEMTLSEIKIKDIMTKSLISVDPGTTVFQVANMMEKGGIGAVLVKKNGAPAGIITDRDYAIKITVNKQPDNTPVEKVASYPLETINAEESILEAADQMSSKKIRKLAVVNDGKVIGIVTSTDLVNELAKNKNV